MSSTAIRAEGLGKQYRIGARGSYTTLRESFGAAVRGAFTRSPSGSTNETFWALKDVSFEVGHGDIVGIVGRNGSGKSTLLKILSRITEPTAGRAVIEGTVGSLLEVGTGFHPELTGRENVLVNGAILGMRRREIERKFDQIVAFADLARFIDTPVKRYSSGMQMRLAFSVAAHLEPNILLVDEVLAVGDLAFQRQCLGKMEDVSRQGRTVLLVSHQLGQIRRLCTKTMWLDRGSVRDIGETGETIRRYEAAMLQGEDAGPGHCFQRWELPGGSHTLRRTGEPFVVRAHVNLPGGLSSGHYGLSIVDDEDRLIAGWAFEPLSLSPGSHQLDVTIQNLPLQPRSYHLVFALFDRGSNLTSGRLIEKWPAFPTLTLDVPPVGHPQDEWAGVLNIPAALAVSGTSQVEAAALQVAG